VVHIFHCGPLGKATSLKSQRHVHLYGTARSGSSLSANCPERAHLDLPFCFSATSLCREFLSVHLPLLVIVLLYLIFRLSPLAPSSAAHRFMSGIHFLSRERVCPKCLVHFSRAGSVTLLALRALVFSWHVVLHCLGPSVDTPQPICVVCFIMTW
jgi:hypothetical protein